MAIDGDTQRRSHEYGLNDALFKFNRLLSEGDELGMVLADEFNEAFKSYMTDYCFDKFPNTSLDRIAYPVIQLKNEFSHLHQINDIILGAICFSLREMGHNFLPVIKDNFWGMNDKPTEVFYKGFTIFPEVAKYQHIREAKRKIKEKFVRQCGISV